MARGLNHVKLTDRDVLELTQCLTWLNKVHDSVNATGMAGKAAVMELTSGVYHVLENLLAREQGRVISWQARMKAKQETAGGQGDS